MDNHFYRDKFGNLFYKIDINEEDEDRCTLNELCPYYGENTVKPCKMMYKNPIKGHDSESFEDYCKSLNIGKKKHYIPLEISENLKSGLLSGNILLEDYWTRNNFHVQIKFELLNS